MVRDSSTSHLPCQPTRPHLIPDLSTSSHLVFAAFGSRMTLQSASNRIIYQFSSMCELFHVLPNKIAIRELLYFAAMNLMSWKNDWVPQTKVAMRSKA
ncbi:hypothetical protein DVH24_003481 [Malus domestica]|uniref:Uncharacterized protein n=1 Tax=Malus domestica TaxID=3750 RepID=A0A498IP31_MALDO|nr:hypothetical protein DVH24_003481 [Malus domestica]